VSLALPADDPDTIRRQIDHTRTQMEGTLNAIGERLSPENLVAQAKESAREATVGRIRDMRYQANDKLDEMSNGLGRTIRDNPLPVALIGLGLGWLWKSSRDRMDNGRDYPAYRSDSYGYYETDERSRMRRGGPPLRERVGEVAHSVGEAVSDRTHRATESTSEAIYRAGEAIGETAENIQERVEGTAENVRHRVGETADNLQERVGETAEAIGESAERARAEAMRLRHEAERRGRMAARRTSRTFTETMEENPLMVAAIAALAGVAVGASMPATEYENQLLGETRDQLFSEARTRAQDAVERVQAVVEDTGRAVAQEAKQSARRHDLSLGDDM